MSADVIEFGPARERRTDQREREEAARGGYFTPAEFAAIYEAAPPAEKLRIVEELSRVRAQQRAPEGPHPFFTLI